MSAADNLLTNSNKVADTTYWPSDKVIFSNTGTFSATNTVGVTSVFTIPSPTNGQESYPVGIYSVNGGTTWNDFTGDLGPWGSSLGIPTTIVPVMAWAESGMSNTTTYRVKCSVLQGGGGTFPIIISVALLALKIPSPLTYIPTIASGETKTSSTTITPTGGQVRYRRIIDTLATAAGSGTIIQVAHNSGYIPDVAWWTTDGSDVRKISSTTVKFVHGSTTIDTLGVFGFAMDSTNFYMSSYPGLPNSLYFYRTYKP